MLEPSLFAGTWAQYSKKASPQENSMTRMSGQEVEIFISWSFRCPYQAKVIKMFDTIRSSIVQKPCILKKVYYDTFYIDINLVTAQRPVNVKWAGVCSCDPMRTQRYFIFGWSVKFFKKYLEFSFKLYTFAIPTMEDSLAQ